MFSATQNLSFRSILVLAALTLLTCLTPDSAAGSTLPIAESCSGTLRLEAGARHLDATPSEGCLEVTSEAGILLLDLAAPGSHTRMTVELCPGSEDVLAKTVGTTPGQRILSLDRSAELLVCTLTLDPGGAGARTLRTAWATANKNQHIEIEPDGNVDGESANKNQHIEIEPDGNVDDENQHIEIEPDGNVEGGVEGEGTAKNQHIEIEPDLFETLCQPRSRDDHADLDLCASHLLTAEGTRGRIDSEGDRDVLVLELADLATVAVFATGEETIEVELFDDRGNRLARLGDEAEILTLAAGTYFLRLSGVPQRWQIRAEVL